MLVPKVVYVPITSAFHAKKGILISLSLKHVEQINALF